MNGIIGLLLIDLVIVICLFELRALVIHLLKYGISKTTTMSIPKAAVKEIVRLVADEMEKRDQSDESVTKEKCYEEDNVR